MTESKLEQQQKEIDRLRLILDNAGVAYHCKAGRCNKSHDSVTCFPDGKRCEHYYKQEGE